MGKIGIIYVITNVTNYKVYVGQTKYDITKKEKGADNRWKQHVGSATKKRNRCVLFERAIRKYGKDNFVVKTLAYCDLKMRDDLETKYIYIYNSTDRNCGYNISSGGQGPGSNRDYLSIMTEEKRANISASKNPKVGIPGINEHYRDKKLVGYRVQREQDGKTYIKHFTDQSRSLEENLELAKQYLEMVKTNTVSGYNSFNRKTDMPRNIYAEKKNGNIIGYRFIISKNGKQYGKKYISEEYTIEEKYEMAVNEKNKWLEMEGKFSRKEINKETYDKYLKGLEQQKLSNRKLPTNILEEKNKGVHIGYRFQIIVDGKVHSRSFCVLSMTMEEKLALAIKEKEEYLKQMSKNQ